MDRSIEVPNFRKKTDTVSVFVVNWPILCALHMDFGVNTFNFNKHKYFRLQTSTHEDVENPPKWQKLLKNLKLHLKCAGLRWSQNQKNLFPPRLYIVQTFKFAWSF